MIEIRITDEIFAAIMDHNYDICSWEYLGKTFVSTDNEIFWDWYFDHYSERSEDDNYQIVPKFFELIENEIYYTELEEVLEKVKKQQETIKFLRERQISYQTSQSLEQLETLVKKYYEDGTEVWLTLLPQINQLDLAGVEPLEIANQLNGQYSEEGQEINFKIKGINLAAKKLDGGWTAMLTNAA